MQLKKNTTNAEKLIIYSISLGFVAQNRSIDKKKDWAKGVSE